MGFVYSVYCVHCVYCVACVFGVYCVYCAHDVHSLLRIWRKSYMLCSLRRVDFACLFRMFKVIDYTVCIMYTAYNMCIA